LHFKFVLRKKSKEVPSADKLEKDQGSHTGSTLGTTYLCVTLPRLAQEAPKSVLRGGAATHKNRTANAIPNQNSRNLV